MPPATQLYEKRLETQAQFLAAVDESGDDRLFRQGLLAWVSSAIPL